METKKGRQELMRRMKIERFFGWLTLATVTFATILLITLVANGEGLGTLRPLIVIPLGVWYGIRCLNKAKELKEELDYGNTNSTDS